MVAFLDKFKMYFTTNFKIKSHLVAMYFQKMVYSNCVPNTNQYAYRDLISMITTLLLCVLGLKQLSNVVFE